MARQARTGRSDAPPETVTSIEELYEEFAGGLFVFALRIVGDRQAAEEIVQDTLLRAWQHADRFDPARGSLATWVFTIARNLSTDRHRRLAARPREVILLDEPSPLVASDVDAALEAWELAEALSHLSPEHRAAIIDVHYRGFTVREAAQRSGVPAGTVKSRLFYGLRSLRLQLEEMGVVQ